MSWTERDIEMLLKAGKIRGATALATVVPKKQESVRKATKKPKALCFIESVLTEAGVAYQTEYRFCKERKFRFDIAVPDLMLAAEYEGIYGGKSRHTTVSGYSRDAEKYTLAAVMGWRVLRYTASTYKNFESDLKAIIQ